jgi:asparagine synthase (glutamine-hydrolysing)
MCGIIGIFGEENALNLIKKGLKIIANRGKDGFGVANEREIDYKNTIDELSLSSKNLIAHNLHAIVNHVLQPISYGDSKLVANCEIYNWKELNLKHNLNARNDAEMLIRLIELLGFDNALKEIDGPYAIAYWKLNKVYLARDLIGIKPLWFTLDNFSFASERKALIGLNRGFIQELHPRKILEYDLEKKSHRVYQRPFFRIGKNILSYSRIKKNLEGLLVSAIAKRIPDQKLGLLFSGGIDSSIIALILKKLGVDFECYSAGLEDELLKYPEDLAYAKKASKLIGCKLNINTISRKEVPEYLKKIVPLIEDNNVVKVGVAIPFFLASEKAAQYGIKVLFSGLGSEEIFAGYDRHKRALDINKECLQGLKIMYERDLYRDDVVTMANTIELRLPFLDNALIEFALGIPAKYKINKNTTKFILRDLAKDLGLSRDIAERPKKAAQYGSNFDKAITKLAKSEKKKKSEYLAKFYPKNFKLGVLFSSGKDSNLALEIMHNQNYDIRCLITIDSKNKSSYMYHTPNIWVAEKQAEALGLPIIVKKTHGNKEEELYELKEAIREAKEVYEIEGIVTGALYSRYQRDRVQRIADELGLKTFNPLWHINQVEELKELIRKGYEVIIVSIGADGLNKDFLGKKIDEKTIAYFEKLEKKLGFNPAGEGGEYESLVLDGPLYKQKLFVDDAEAVIENENTGFYIVNKILLKDKNSENNVA